MTLTTHRAVLPLAISAAVAIGLTGCSSDSSDSPEASGAGTAASSTAAAAASSSAPIEIKPGPRLAITYDGGVMVLDGSSLEVLAEIPFEGYTRVNDAGDGRHLFVSADNAFQVIDMGIWAEPHGSHTHTYGQTPALTDVRFDASDPGHVVVHDGITTLFADGTGEVTSFPSAELAEGVPADVTEYTAPSPHHGVAVMRHDGSMVISVGTEDERTGVAILDSHHHQIAVSNECPGIHGEAAASGGVLAFGCEDGVLLVDGNEFHKAQATVPYARIGNQRGNEASRYLLGDYKTDKDAELERPTTITITDSETATTALVELGTSYSFRSLAMTLTGTPLVLGTDGQVHVIDPATAKVVRSFPVVEPWEESLEWQDPRPALHVSGSRVYVTDPSTDRVLQIDPESGDVIVEAELPHTPDETASVSGKTATE